MFRCKFLKKELIAYLEGSLPEAQRKTIENHLAYCVRCNERVRFLRETKAIIGTLKYVPEPPASFFQLIYQRIRDYLLQNR